MIYANGEEGSVTLPVLGCLTLAATLGCLMCLCTNAPPPYYVACPSFGISIGVCFCMFVLMPVSSLTEVLYRAVCICELLFNSLPQLLYSFPNTQG